MHYHQTQHSTILYDMFSLKWAGAEVVESNLQTFIYEFFKNHLLLFLFYNFANGSFSIISLVFIVSIGSPKT